VAVTDQEYAFNIYSALKSGTKDDVRFDAWTDSAPSSLSLMTATRTITSSSTDLTRRGINSTLGDVEEVFLEETEEEVDPAVTTCTQDKSQKEELLKMSGQDDPPEKREKTDTSILSALGDI
jgi:hypothetical protein